MLTRDLGSDLLKQLNQIPLSDLAKFKAILSDPNTTSANLLAILQKDFQSIFSILDLMDQFYISAKQKVINSRSKSKQEDPDANEVTESLFDLLPNNPNLYTTILIAKLNIFFEWLDEATNLDKAAELAHLLGCIAPALLKKEKDVRGITQEIEKIDQAIEQNEQRIRAEYEYEEWQAEFRKYHQEQIRLSKLVEPSPEEKDKSPSKELVENENPQDQFLQEQFAEAKRRCVAANEKVQSIDKQVRLENADLIQRKQEIETNHRLYHEAVQDQLVKDMVLVGEKNKLRSQQILQIFFHLQQSLIANHTYHLADISRAFSRAKREVFSGPISKEISDEIVKLKYLLDKQLSSPRMQAKSPWQIEDIQYAIQHAGYLYAVNRTEEEIKLTYFQAVKQNCRNEVAIEAAVMGRELISKEPVTLKSIQPYFDKYGNIKGKSFTEIGTVKHEKAVTDNHKNIRLDYKRIKTDSITYGLRKKDDPTPISRQEIIVNAAIGSSFSDVMNSVPELNSLYANKLQSLDVSLTEQTFYQSITSLTNLEDICIDAFKELTASADMALEDPADGYEFRVGFNQALAERIERPCDQEPHTSTITREQLIGRFANVGDVEKEIENSGLSGKIANQFFEYGSGELKQISADCGARNMRVMNTLHLGFSITNKELRLEERETYTQLVHLLGEKAAEQLVLSHSQGPASFIPFAMGHSVDPTELSILPPNSASRAEPTVVIGTQLPTSLALDTFYVVFAKNTWSLTYVDYYGKQIKININDVKDLATFLNGKDVQAVNSQKIQLRQIIKPYRLKHFIEPLQKVNYVKDENGDLYVTADYKLFPIIDVNTEKPIGCLGPARSTFKFKDRGNLEVRYVERQLPKDTSDIPPNTYVFLRDAKNNWSCFFKEKDSLNLKPINFDHLPQDINDTLKKVQPDEEMTVDQARIIQSCIKQIRYGFELVEIKTDEPYLVHALDGKLHTTEEVQTYSDFHRSCHFLEEAIKERKLSGNVNQRVLIDAEYALNRARKACCNKLAVHSVPDFTTCMDDITQIVERSSAKSTERVLSLNEYLLNHDILKTLDQFEQRGRYADSFGVAMMIDIKNDDALELEEKSNKIVNEAKLRISRTSCITRIFETRSWGGFFRNSVFFDAIGVKGPRTDEVNLLYWAIAEKEANLCFNPNISTVEQLIIAQQKREAIATLQDDIRRLNTPFVGTGMFGGAGRVSDILPSARMKIMAYQELIRIITESSHMMSLSELLDDVFEKNPDKYLVNQIDSDGQGSHPNIRDTLFKVRGSWKTTSDAEIVITDLRNKTIDPRSVIEDVGVQQPVVIPIAGLS